jgi:hypothetical protein
VQPLPAMGYIHYSESTNAAFAMCVPLYPSDVVLGTGFMSVLGWAYHHLSCWHAMCVQVLTWRVQPLPPMASGRRSLILLNNPRALSSYEGT